MFCAFPQMWLRWRVAVSSWWVPVGNYWTQWCISWETWSQDSVINLKCMLAFFAPFKWNALSCSAAQVMTVVFPLPHYSFPVEETIFGSSFPSNIPCRYTQLYPGFVSLGKSLKHHFKGEQECPPVALEGVMSLVWNKEGVRSSFTTEKMWEMWTNFIPF